MNELEGIHSSHNACCYREECQKQADKIAELEKQLQESAMDCISAYKQADDHYARVQELEKNLHMTERHYERLCTEKSEPVAIPFCWYCAWLGEKDEPVWDQYEECHPATKQWDNFPDKTIPLYTHPVKELHLSLQKDKETGELLAVTYTDDEHRIVEVLWEKPPVKELNDGGEPVKNATYWKRQYNLMATQNDNLKSGLYHANEQIKYLERQVRNEI